jgi:hypothetical protein
MESMRLSNSARISFVCRYHQGIEDMNFAICKADDSDIIMLASCPDVGSPGGDSLLRPGIMNIRSCNQYGEPSMSFTYEHYGFIGENIAVNMVPFLTQNTTVSGNPISTAIATGLASIILSCRYAVDNEDRVRRQLIQDYFRLASSSNYSVNPRYLGQGCDDEAGRLIVKLFEQVGDSL